MSARTHGRWGLVPGVLLLLAMVAVPALPVAASQRFSDPGGAFSLILPDGWSPQQPSDTSYVEQWGNTDGNAIVLLGVQTIPAGTSSLDFYNANADGFTGLNGFQVVNTRYVTSNGGNQPLIEFTFLSGGQMLRVQQVFIASGTNGWTLTLLTANNGVSRYAPAFTTMVQSFTVPQPTGNSAATTTGTNAGTVQGQRAGSPPTGHYACQSDYSGFIAGGFALNGDRTYLLDEGTSGGYQYDQASGRITFTSGPYAQAFYGDYQLLTSATSSTPTIFIRSLGGQQSALICQPGF